MGKRELGGIAIGFLALLVAVVMIAAPGPEKDPPARHPVPTTALQATGR